MAAAEANLADCYNRIGLYSEAEAALRAALDSCRRVRNRRTEGYIYANLGYGLSASGRQDEAIASLIDAERVANEVGDARLLAMIGIYRTGAELARGDLAAAAACADRTIASARAKGLQGYAARAMAVRAAVSLAAGQTGNALEESGRALAIRDELGGVEENEADIFVTHAEALRRSGRESEAEEVIRRGRGRLRELAARISDPVWRDRFLRGPAAHRKLMGE
jgi:tetratricopeptide (TPR) repeat protein